jgi:acetyl esterase
MLYNRAAQRPHERWSLTSRLLARVFAHPELVLRLLRSADPIERDGRVLSREVQALVGAAGRLGAVRDGRRGGGHPPDPEAMRSQLRSAARAVMPVRTDVHVTERAIPGPDGHPGLRIRLYRQFGSGLGRGSDGRSEQPAIVFYHGGGWVSGDLDSHDATCRLLAAASQCLVVAADYRVAPEHPFPAAVDDALAAYQWVHRHADELGVAPGRVGVMGDSAGGNLAAVVAQQALRPPVDGPTVPPPVAQCLVYPAVDAHLDTDSIRSLGEGFFLTLASMEFYRLQYLPKEADWDLAAASPLLAADLSGLAPALIVTAGFDPLRDDGANYARALAQAGVDVEYRCYDDQVHGFMGMGILADSLALATEVCDAMGRLMRRSEPSVAE